MPQNGSSNDELVFSTTSSPHTAPATPDSNASDFVDPTPSFGQQFHHDWKNLAGYSTNSMDYTQVLPKYEEQKMALEDLIHESAIEESPLITSSPPTSTSNAAPITWFNRGTFTFNSSMFGYNSTPVPQPVVPAAPSTLYTPASTSLGFLGSTPQSGVLSHSPDSLMNLQLVLRDVPKKSRVETQVKLHLDLTESSVLPQTSEYATVDRWQYIRVPKTSSIKQRSRSSVCDPNPDSVLTLEVAAICATPPNLPAWACQACIQREAKRNARKTKMQTSGSESEHLATQGASDNLVCPIDFTCHDLLDFSSGTTQISFRVICYCRHHREKVGFHVDFTLKDNFGRTVAQGRTTPIMITDDHKTAGPKLTPATTADEDEVEVSAPPRRKRRAIEREDVKPSLKKRIQRVSALSRIASSSPPAEPPIAPQTAPTSPLQNRSTIPQPGSSLVQSPVSLPMIPMALQPLPVMPRIDRLIPNSGPMTGGIDVTILGSNFRADLNLFVFFGGSPSSQLQFYSENVLICKLPPSLTPGVVSVQLSGVPDDPRAPLFTYTDETDRDLMVMALQLVGMQMSGQIQEARSVALSIIGPSGFMPSGQPNGGTQMSREDQQLEQLVLDLLRKADGHLRPHVFTANPTTGQTLLHLSAIMGFERLTQRLLELHADIDARDMNGFTPLHFACYYGMIGVAKILLQRGADQRIVDGRSRAPFELASEVARVELEEFDFDSGSDGNNESSGEEGDDEGNSASEDEVDRQSLTGASLAMLSRRGSSSSIVSWKARNGAGSGVRSEDDETVVAPSSPGPTTPTGNQQRWRPMRNMSLPSLPFSMQFPNWNLPDLPDMPFRLNRRGGSQSKDSDQPDEKANVAMMNWWKATLMWMKVMQEQQREQQLSEDPPPMYTAEPTSVSLPAEKSTATSTSQQHQEEHSHDLSATSATVHAYPPPRLHRRVDYDPSTNSPLSEREVNAYAYRSLVKKANKKDKMLVFFWIPVLILVFTWALYRSLPLVHNMYRTVFEHHMPPTWSSAFVRT